jgi:uncharacterized membrane protein YuzA (DUF378 family)
MKSKSLVTGLFVIALLLVMTISVSASAPTQPGPAPATPPSFADLVLQWGSLAGAGVLIAVLINIGKALGWVHEGQSTTWSTILNIVGMIALLLLQIFKPDMDIAALDGAAGQIAQVLIILVGLVTQMLSSKGAHFALKGTPLIGKSFSLPAPKNDITGS